MNVAFEMFPQVFFFHENEKCVFTLLKKEIVSIEICLKIGNIAFLRLPFLKMRSKRVFTFCQSFNMPIYKKNINHIFFLNQS